MTTVPCPSPVTPGSTASVTVTQVYTYVSPIMALLGSSVTTKTLTSTGVMACIG